MNGVSLIVWWSCFCIFLGKNEGGSSNGKGKVDKTRPRDASLVNGLSCWLPSPDLDLNGKTMT